MAGSPKRARCPFPQWIHSRSTETGGRPMNDDEEMTVVYGLTSIFLSIFIFLLILAGLGSLPVWVIFAGLIVINAILIAGIVNDIRNNK
uniref:Uncharacterized protein n=2 Tax=unclassified Caudoviricetes TaxID=2788787 RepID=A0A075EHX4_9CAUD|nr:hypothetical protein [Siphovirus contig89]AIE38404.1 hypothetical protein [Siphovirus contig89]AIE38447.1 hypothetical protein [Siphovirus contig89]AIE38490.1 hypothetical protein [Siphovirus contig89]AIE38533.1 hypothetical protein [Siphovirus contig89]